MKKLFLILVNLIVIMGGVNAQEICSMANPDNNDIEALQLGICSNPNVRINNDRFFPMPDDPIKTVRLNFIFLQRPGDEAAGIGGYHLSNSNHLALWTDVAAYMNETMGHFEVQHDANDCSWNEYVDTRIRFEVDMFNIEDAYYWNNENGYSSGNPASNCTATDICPNTDTWYAINLHDDINNSVDECSRSINIFFTENGTEYDNVTNGFAYERCSTSCSKYPANPQTSVPDLRIHMVDKYIKLQGFIDWGNTSDIWVWDWDPNVPNTTRHEMVKDHGNHILHELGHSFDLPHTNNSSQWPFPESSCNLMCNTGYCITNDTHPYSLTDIQLKAMHKALSVKTTREYVDGCVFNENRVIEINQDELWDDDIKVYKNIVVKSGATLTLSCVLHMPPNSKIIVERGGKLIIDGATITNTCNCNRWQGIEVHGKSNIAHNTLFGSGNVENLTVADYENLSLDANGPGVVILKNDAIIENAGSSITTKKRESGGDSNYYGGIVYAENSTFTNNRRAVEFMRYAPQNYSQFRNCSFTSDEELPKPYVTMWDTHGVTFDACNFVGTGGGSDYGIYSIDAGYNIAKNNSFTDFTIGISATNGGTLTDLNIGQAEATQYNATTANQFSNCVIGVYVAGADDAEIVGNDFSQNTVGLYNESSKYAKTKFNHFTETTTANANTGIVYMQTDDYEADIYQNTFTNIYNSIYASQNNLGLKIKCNENINSAYNLVINGTEAIQGSIHPQQGSGTFGESDAPASNKFGTYFNPNTHIHTQGNTAVFNYFHHRNLVYIPIYDAGANYTKTEHDTYVNELCFPNDVSDECPNPPCEEYLFDLKTEIDNLKNIRATHEESSFAYKALTEDISYLEYKLAVALKGSVKEYEKSGNIDEAINLLEQSDKEQAAWQKVRLQIKYGRYDKAAEVLSLLPQDELKKQQFVQLQELQLRLRTSNRSYAELTNAETAALEDIASSETTQAIYARNILNFIDDNYGEAAMPIIIPSTGKWHSSKTSLTISNMNLVPNPAKERVHISYNGEKLSENLLIFIYDLHGKLILSEKLVYGNCTLDISTMKQGIYFSAIIDENKNFIANERLVIID